MSNLLRFMLLLLLFNVLLLLHMLFILSLTEYLLLWSNLYILPYFHLYYIVVKLFEYFLSEIQWQCSNVLYYLLR